MKEKLSWLLILAVLVFCAVKTCRAEETVEKIDENTVKVTISSVNEKEGVKTTLSQERNFTLEGLLERKAASEKALQSWQDVKIKAEENIALQTAQVAMWERLLANSEGLGVVAKVEAIE